MTYVDGFVVPVPEGNREAYIASAKAAKPIFFEHGALHHVECWSTDIPKGEHTDFFRAVQAKDGECVVFSWITWPSKEVRDAAWEAMMSDDRMKTMDMPFDGKRMFWGGFETVFDSKSDA
ncbi:DUF1428 domain-containing protein [Stakelama sediminis]|uniref:Uncharacterized protein YbaA (DUF1428 family) n=1 Tax=Stakelama sediminis TaxID=463200 RepID=A0A840YZ54_9SPHN|nr:DUF1428 domain-containing protein [Stakelama sediminis]MBB5719081.1 uncharacterized protein YbaA (DUF1428 family) [Stakelama sediminis]